MPNGSNPTTSIVSVRRATNRDARLLAALGARLFEQSFGAANAPDDIRSHVAATFSIESQERELDDADYATWIAEDAGRAAIGYATLCRGSTAPGVTGVKPAELRRIYVDQPWHGRGAGDSLMRACAEQARAWRCDVLWLGVWEQNPRAIAFYEKTGFERVGHQIFILGTDQQQDIVMARRLA